MYARRSLKIVGVVPGKTVSHKILCVVPNYNVNQTMLHNMHIVASFRFVCNSFDSFFIYYKKSIN